MCSRARVRARTCVHLACAMSSVFIGFGSTVIKVTGAVVNMIKEATVRIRTRTETRSHMHTFTHTLTHTTCVGASQVYVDV